MDKTDSKIPPKKHHGFWSFWGDAFWEGAKKSWEIEIEDGLKQSALAIPTLIWSRFKNSFFLLKPGPIPPI